MPMQLRPSEIGQLMIDDHHFITQTRFHLKPEAVGGGGRCICICTGPYCE